ncbi:ROK family protein [Sinomicrobium sp. M5D2P17]
MPVTIGVDIGGSHISSAAVDMERSEIIPGTYFRGDVNSKATKKEIFLKWAYVINKSLESLKNEQPLGVGIAIPGPFHYKEGIALFKRNDKYESLYGVSVLNELPSFLNQELPIRFLNDATSFGIGAIYINKGANRQRIVAVTFGTGFGATFLKNGLPMVHEKNVPEGGYLWDKDFLDGIADDYFSTRWFLSRYKELSGKNEIIGVKELLELKDIDPTGIFEEFAENVNVFLMPYLKKFGADLLVIGGSIAKAHHYFLPAIYKKWLHQNVSVTVIENTEEASIIGSAYLFDNVFWNQVKDELPVI